MVITLILQVGVRIVSDDGSNRNAKWSPEFKAFPEVSLMEVSRWLEERGFLMTLGKGSSPSRRFNWVVAYPSESLAGSMIDSSKILVICDISELPCALAENPYGFFLVVANGDEKLDSLLSNSKCASVEAGSKLAVEREILDLFQKNMIWETKLDYLVFREVRLDSLIEVGEMGLRGAFLCITDTGFNLIACSHSVLPPSTAYEQLVQTGSYCDQEVDRLRSFVLAGKVNREVFYCPPTEWNKALSVHCPLFVNGEYTFHVTMAVSPDRDIACLEDRFVKFVSRVRFAAERFWNKKLPVKSACHKVLIAIIEGKRKGRAGVEKQLEQSGIPREGLYRLLAIPLKSDISRSFMNQLQTAVQSLNEGRSHAFVYDGSLLVLLFDGGGLPKKFSLMDTIRQYDDNVFGICMLEAGVSQVFDDIKDIRWAYLQCKEAIKRKDAMIRAYPSGYSGISSRPWPCFPFDHVLFLMMNEKDVDEGLMDFSFENSLLIRFVGRDSSLKKTVLELLWRYICNDGNATRTAEEVHMHRNTVLYHIRKFEDQFGLSLDSPMVKHRVMADCLHYMCRDMTC